jgi:dTDP-4-dehydrorhamnose reductase
MKILITGINGMLGQALKKQAQIRNIDTIGIDLNNADIVLDITDSKNLIKTIKNIKPDIIINTAALVNLNQCEQNPEFAYKINAEAVETLAKVSKDINAYLIQISTDHFFTGKNTAKHKETDKVTLLNEYAKTKYQGEQFALCYENSLIIRTNIVGFRNKKDSPTFIEWVLQTLKEKSPITLFNDFFTSSITVTQLSKAIFDLLLKKPIGILNIASREVSNKKTFIEALAKNLNFNLSNAKIGSVNDKKILKRANCNGLDVSKAECILEYNLPTLNEVINNIVNEYNKTDT